jgi:hypothetical protein
MEKTSVEVRHDSFYLGGSRVPLDSIVFQFKRGEAPESIRANFPTLTLEQVYGAVTFYLGNKDAVEKDMAERRRLEAEFSATHPAPPHLKEKIERARGELFAHRS